MRTRLRILETDLQNADLKETTADWNLAAEIKQIQEWAAKGVSKLIIVKDFVLFSTDDKAAFLLADDGYAAILTVRGENNPYLEVDETGPTILVGMDGRYEWVGDKLVIRDDEGIVLTATGLGGLAEGIRQGKELVEKANKGLGK